MSDPFEDPETVDWDRLASMAGSESRGRVLAEAFLVVDLDEARRLIEDHWTTSEAWGEDLDIALETLAEVGYVGPALPDGSDPLTVYRATGGDIPDGGSWTLDRAVAERFSHLIASPRGRFLGYHSDTPALWSGKVNRTDVLGYFIDRQEAEVVLPHGAIRDVQLLAASCLPSSTRAL